MSHEVTRGASVELALTYDALLRGRLPLAQPRVGYRTNVDALWLANFARGTRPARRAIDLGAGVGAVGLALLLTGGARAALLVDVDGALLTIARDNAVRAGLADRIEVFEADLARPLPAPLRSAFDLAVANPPFGVERSVRVSADPRRARARSGPQETLAAFARSARAALGGRGRACFVHPAHDLARLLSTLRAVGLEPKRMRLVHPLAAGPARVALVEGKPARAGGLRVESPLVVMSAPGVYTDEALAIMDGPE